MTTTWTVKLTQGKRELNLNDGTRYRPTLDFLPPAVSTLPLIASGTSANRYGGGTKISERATDRIMILPLYINGASDAEVARGVSQLAQFLSLAGSDSSNPLYLEVRPNSDVAFEPLWGNYGTNLRYEVIHATPPSLATDYSRGDMRARRATVTSILTLKPYAVGKQQRLGSATGGVLEDTIGWKDGYSRGTIIPEATVNLILNPVFGSATYNANWDDGANVTEVK